MESNTENIRQKISKAQFYHICGGIFSSGDELSKFYYHRGQPNIHLFDCDIIDDIAIPKYFQSIQFTNCNLQSLVADERGGALKLEDCKLKELKIKYNSPAKIVLLNSTINTAEFDQARSSILDVNSSVINSLQVSGTNLNAVSVTNSKISDFGSVNNEISAINIHNSIFGNWSFNGDTIGEIEISVSRIFSLKFFYIKADSKKLVVSNSNVNYFLLDTTNEYEIIVHESSTIYHLRINNFILTSKVRIHIADTLLNNVELEYFNNGGLLVFSNVKATTSMEEFVTNTSNGSPVFNDGKFEFISSIKKSRISFINSDLGDTQFMTCDLKGFDEFVFRNSKMLDVFLADTPAPISSRIKTVGGEDDKAELLEQKRLVFNQFKKIYEKQGDFVRSSECLAEELEVYREQLKLQSHVTRKGRWNRRAEMLNLWLNRYSNYYGNNWLRSLITTLAVNFALFTIYCFALGYRFGQSIPLFWNLFSFSFEFLNPLRKADFLNSNRQNVDVNALARIIDYTSRIIVAYFVYQTIQAFRKFGRKSG